MSGPADHRGRVALLLDLGRYVEARAAVERALAESPDDPALLVAHADALAGTGDHASALASAGRAVALAPDDPAAHRRRAIALARLGDHADATVAARQVVRLAPEDWSAHTLLATCAAEDPATREEAWEASGRAVTLGPTVAEAHAAVGFVATRRGDRAAAVRAYRAALALKPDHATSIHNLGLLEGGTDLARVARGVAGALRLEPQNPDFRATVDRWTWRTVAGAWAAPLAALLVVVPASLDNPAEQAGSSFPTSAFSAVLLVGVLATWWTVTLVRLPRGVRRRGAAYVRDDPGLLAMLVATALGVGGVLLIGFSPREGPRVVLTTVVVLAVHLATLTAALVVRSRRGVVR